jgi:hypothetical protein
MNVFDWYSMRIYESFYRNVDPLHFLPADTRTGSRKLVLALLDSLLVTARQVVDKPDRDVAIRARLGRKV